MALISSSVSIHSLITTDRQTSVVVDLAEETAAKTALQNAATDLAERLAPTIERYELVGKPGAPIEAPAWLSFAVQALYGAEEMTAAGFRMKTFEAHGDTVAREVTAARSS